MPVATVIRLYSDVADVVLDDAASPGLVATARLRGRLAAGSGSASLLAVGDRVEVALVDAAAVIEAVLPRRSKISRRHPSNPRREQVIAANVEQVLVVGAATQPRLRPGLVDRHLVAAALEGLQAALCLTKCDAATTGLVDEILAPYREVGVRCFPVGRGDDESVEALRHRFLAGRTTVLVGPSGAGKTTLRNRLLPHRAVAATAEISPSTGKGRHRTSAATLEPLSPAGFLVDTPGVRAFGLWDVQPDAIKACFPEFADAACAFTDCRHGAEPGCGLRERVAAGTARAERLESLRALALGMDLED